MNPALPAILLVGLAGFLLPGRRLRLAWLFFAAAAAVFLWPSLRLSDGVPSPAASLARMHPWTLEGDPDEGNPTLVDVTFQIQPWQLHLRRELRAGRLPFWNPHQFAGAPFWANGQSAPLFPLHLLFAALPLELGLVLLPWLRLLVAGLGGWALARQLGVGPRCALLAGLVFPLGGMMSSFMLFPMANALCLVPWILRQVDRLARGQGSWGGLVLLAGGQMLGGHPETPIHTAMLSALYLAWLPEARRLRLWIELVGAWAAAGCLAAVQLLPLALNLLESSRWQAGVSGEPAPLGLLVLQPLRLIFPNLYGHPAQATWWGPFNYNATEVFAGLITVLLAWVGLRTRLRDPRWRAVAVLLVFSLLAAYHVPGLRQVLLALPLVGSMLHHRLLFAVDLCLGLLAAAGLERWLGGHRRAAAEGAVLLAVGLALGWWRFGGQWRSRELLAEPLAWTAWGLAAALLVLLPERWPDAWLGRWSPRWQPAMALALGLLVLAELTAAHARTNPGLPLDRLYPETPAVGFLQGKPERIAGVGWSLRPNAAMVYGLYDVRGDDTIKAARFEEVYRGFGGASPFYFEPIEDWDSPWLDRLGVRWILSGPHRPPEDESWRLAWQSPEARVWERPAARPLVYWSDGSTAGLEAQRQGPGGWSVGWDRPGGGRLVVAESWDPGWRASSAGRALAIERVDGILLGVDLAADQGELQLRYRPQGIAAGLALSAAGLAAGLAGLRRRRSAAGETA